MNPAVYYLSSLETNIPYVPTELPIPNGQIWDQYNLNTSVYSDGTRIPKVDAGWTSLSTGAWRYYDNDSTNGVLFGRLYNWYAVNGVYDAASLSDPLLRKDIAPEGWRVATFDDWTALISYYGVNSVAAGYLKQYGFDYWSSPNTGALISNIFNARGGGLANGATGVFDNKYVAGYWWPFNSDKNITMAFNSAAITGLTAAVGFNRGSSVRLIKKDIVIPGFTTTLGTALAKSVPTGGNIPTSYTETPSEIGIAWGTLSNPNIIANNKIEYIPAGLGPYSITLSGLSPSTTYNIRAYAIITSGTAYADNVTFTTQSGVASLTTNAVTDITASTATCGGNITNDGGDTITERGVCWNTSSSPTIANSRTIDGSGTGSFISSLTGLSSSSTYYVRAYATNGVTTSYGNEQSFITSAGVGLILDLYPSAHHAYSLRKLRTLYTGASLRVRRTVGATTVIVDVNFDATTEAVALTSTITPFSGITTATTLGQFAAIAGYGTPDVGVPANQNIFVVTWFDQSGNGKNPTNATAGQQPRLVNSANLERSGGKVAVRFTRASSNNLLITDTTANINNMSSYWVGAFVGGTGSQVGYLLAVTNRFYFPSTGGAAVYAGYGTSATAITLEAVVSSNRRLYELISPSPSNSSVAQGWSNGVAGGTRAIVNASTTNIQIGTGGTNYFDGHIQEIIGWQSNAGREGKEININTYWTIYP